jgi:hypothetical protein
VLETVRKSVRRALGCISIGNFHHYQITLKARKKSRIISDSELFPLMYLVEISGIEPLTS